jgi:hypothetical protein
MSPVHTHTHAKPGTAVTPKSPAGGGQLGGGIGMSDFFFLEYICIGYVSIAVEHVRSVDLCICGVGR